MFMKYAIIIPDGAADEPQESLGGKTPLQAAAHAGDGCDCRRPASSGARTMCRRRCRPVPMSPVLSLLGYNPLEHFTGRAPLEAAAQGIELGPDDWAIRCNLVTVENQTMRDFTAGHISTEEATAAVGHGTRTHRQRLAAVLSRRQLSQSAGLSRRETARRRFPRHAGHAAARSDRQIGAATITRAAPAAICSLD